jgi:hypothetical protein
MKPREILEKYELKCHYYVGQATTLNILEKYKDEDCIICYLTETIGFCFIIKTKRTFMAFYGHRLNYLGGNSYNVKRCSLNEAIKLLNNYENKGTILNQKEYDKVRDNIILNKLED